MPDSLHRARRDASGRLAARIGGEYFLQTVSLLAQSAEGDLLGAIILLAITQSNVAHLDVRGRTAETAPVGPPPDTERRPVSVIALADGLGLPYETVRRRVVGLEKAGWCVRVQGGVVVPAERFMGPANAAWLEVNRRNMRRLMRRMTEAQLFSHPG